MPAISMKELLEAGVHFGHQTKRWNPKMKEYIFGERNGIYIIDLQKTLKLFKDAARYVGEMAPQGKNVLFVGTKRQAQEAIAEEATRCQMYYVNQRWLGGLLTNMTTVQKSIKRLKELEVVVDGRRLRGRARRKSSVWSANASTWIRIWPASKTCQACPTCYSSSIRTRKPSRSRKLGGWISRWWRSSTPTAIPDEVDWVIPGNDDALRAIRLFASKIADSVIEGRALATEQDFAAEKIVTDETVPGEEMPEYTAYVDPMYAEQIMTESLMGEELPGAPSAQRSCIRDLSPVEER